MADAGSALVAAPPTEPDAIKALTPMQVFAPGSIDHILAAIEAKARGVDADISTTKGRDAIRSMAARVRSSKSLLDEMGKTLTEEWRQRTSAVNAERKAVRDRLDALADEVRRPLTEFENAEKARVAAHEEALAAIPESAGYGQSETSDEIRQRLEHLKNLPPRDWQEFAQRAARAFADEIARTEKLLAAAEKREADAHELARLRKEAEERELLRLDQEREAREQRIAAQAAEMARQKAEQDAAAQRDRDAEAARVAEQKRLEAEAEKERAAEAERQRQRDEVEAARKREQAEAARQLRQSEERAEAQRQENLRLAREAKEREEAARQREIAAQQAAEAREREAERRRIEAVAAERKRVADEAEKAKREAARREANLAHTRRVNASARDAIVLEMSEVHSGTEAQASDIATTIVRAIALRKIPHISIQY